MAAMIILLDPVAEKLRQVETLLAAQVDSNRSPLETALASLIVAGGKRLRPRIALLTGAILGANSVPLMNLAAAIEMLHTATLIHDDLVDGSLLRRGVETLNVHWSAAASVLVGDLAFSRAAALILGTHSLSAIAMFTRTMSRMIEGELSQLARERGISNQEEYYRWINAKTASLFELAAGAPALLSAAGEEAFDAARRFGNALGMAFQIVDDVLDFTGESARLGKPAGSDLRQGVMTLPALLYYEEHPDDPDLAALIYRESPTDPALARLIDRIRRGTSIERSLETAQSYVQEALNDLAFLPEVPERAALAELALSTITRDA